MSLTKETEQKYIDLLEQQEEIVRKKDLIDNQIRTIELNGYKDWFNRDMCPDRKECDFEFCTFESDCELAQGLWADRIEEIKQKREKMIKTGAE
jgi:hypothetical protein